MAHERLRAEIVHDSDGRLRLRSRALRGHREACARLKEDLGAASSLNRVDVRAGTGSIIVTYEAPRAAAFSEIERVIKIEKRAPPSPRRRPLARAVQAARRADRELLRASGGRLNLADATFVLLCVGAAIQTGRGSLAMPATGFLLSAFALASRSQRGGATSD